MFGTLFEVSGFLMVLKLNNELRNKSVKKKTFSVNTFRD